ncbi:MAG: HAMP domain-containing sensor histidine kinase [Acidobacteriaceae bacterium]
MTLRQKLLLLFSLTVAGVVVALVFAVTLQVRRAFAEIDRKQSTAVAAHFQSQFNSRGTDLVTMLDRLAASDSLQPMVQAFSSGGNAAPYLAVATPLAHAAHLDYLELVSHDGSILSSAQWPARFGSREAAIAEAAKGPFLKQEDLPDGSEQIGLFAVRAVAGSKPALYLVGGRQLDAGFLSGLAALPGVQVLLYRNLTDSFNGANFAGAQAAPAGVAHLGQIVDQARADGREARGVADWTGRRADSVDAAAFPLKGADGSVLAVLVVAEARRGLVELETRIVWVAVLFTVIGIVVAAGAGYWMAGRIAAPIRQITRAADQAAAGEWETRVDIRSPDEISMLARSFNHMLREMATSRDRLVQNERVAAWRELAQRLASELKGPLFPMQITVENMLRARKLPRIQFDDVFAESAATLQSEIGKLREVVARFSDFAKDAEPQMEKMDVRDAVRHVLAHFAPALEEKHIAIGTAIALEPLPIRGDAELLERALSQLVLNAMEAMPEGGTLTVSAARAAASVRIGIADTGVGLTDEECELLFTPYSHARRNGSGLGLAIVQSVVTDHYGRITVERAENGGVRFVIILPLAAPQLALPQG